MPHLADGLVLLVLVLWFLGTVFFQFAPEHRWLRNGFAISLFPVWHLFAPAPILGDFHILYRNRGTEDDWQEVPVIADHTLLHSVFHPGRYTEKTLTSIVSRLCGDLAISEDVSNSWAYSRLDQFVRQNAAAADIEWAIVESYGYRPNKDSDLLFLSPSHV